MVKEIGGYPTNMLGLIAVGAGIGVLPYFKAVERIPGIVWRTLARPKLWTDFALVWRPQMASPVVAEFVALAERRFPIADEPGRAEV